MAGDLRSRIAAGEFPAGSWLPARKDLAAHYDVSINTVASALKVLAAEKRVHIIWGSGASVLAPPAPSPTLEDVISRLENLEGWRASLQAATTPERQPVVAAIVSNGPAVLVTRRQDGKPPWAFVGGEVDLGESPANAGVREVKEETGLEITAGPEIGRRIHPVTGRTIIYLACRPASGDTRVHVGDAREIAEVKWVSLDEAVALMPDMYKPVLAYLEQAPRT